jgi:hypothetical protein
MHSVCDIPLHDDATMYERRVLIQGPGTYNASHDTRRSPLRGRNYNFSANPF